MIQKILSILKEKKEKNIQNNLFEYIVKCNPSEKLERFCRNYIEKNYSKDLELLKIDFFEFLNTFDIYSLKSDKRDEIEIIIHTIVKLNKKDIQRDLNQKFFYEDYMEKYKHKIWTIKTYGLDDLDLIQKFFSKYIEKNSYYDSSYGLKNIIELLKFKTSSVVLKILNNSENKKILNSRLYKIIIESPKERHANDLKNIQSLIKLIPNSSYNYFLEKFYQKTTLDFNLIDKKDYFMLLKSKDIKFELFDKIVHNIVLEKSNLSNFISILENSKFKDNYKVLIEAFKKNKKAGVSESVIALALLSGLALNKSIQNTGIVNDIEIGATINNFIEDF